MLCVDQSGSMASSVVYASIFAAVLASLPGLATQLICFDTAVVDLTEELKDPVEVLFGVQLGGGTDINAALGYCEQHIEHPAKTHLILISELYEGGNAESMLARVASLKQSGVKVIVLLALSDDGHPAYHNEYAAQIAGCIVLSSAAPLISLPIHGSRSDWQRYRAVGGLERYSTGPRSVVCLSASDFRKHSLLGRWTESRTIERGICFNTLPRASLRAPYETACPYIHRDRFERVSWYQSLNDSVRCTAIS